MFLLFMLHGFCNLSDFYLIKIKFDWKNEKFYQM